MDHPARKDKASLASKSANLEKVRCPLDITQYTTVLIECKFDCEAICLVNPTLSTPRDLIAFRMLTLTPELIERMIATVSQGTISHLSCNILTGIDCNKAFIELKSVFDAFKVR